MSKSLLGTTHSLALTISPDWAQLAVVRESTLSFLRRYAVNDNTALAVAMVACELCENATKYGTFGDENEIDVLVMLEKARVTVEVRNPIGRREADTLSRLDGMVQWIRGFQDPFEAYLERLKEVSSQSLDHEESGLGLVRIAYEGQSVLDFFVTENHVLAVSAVHHV